MKSVVVKIQGGLGNQLFQYAVAKSICLQNNGILFLDINHYENQNPNETYRTFALQMFECKFELFRSNVVKNYLKYNRIKKFFYFLPFVKKYYYESEHSFDASLLKINPPLYLLGNFHSIHYFIKFKYEIRNSLKFRNEFLSLKAIAFANDIEYLENSVSIHFRRTDFVKDKSGNLMGGELPISYYHEAMAKMQMINSNFNLVVFSDDIKWVKSNMNFGVSTIFIEDADDGVDDSGLADLYLMSKCEHHIIANSTFSWWGAFLNPSEKKIVISPKWWILEKYWTPNYEAVILDNI